MNKKVKVKRWVKKVPEGLFFDRVVCFWTSQTPFSIIFKFGFIVSGLICASNLMVWLHSSRIKCQDPSTMAKFLLFLIVNALWFKRCITAKSAYVCGASSWRAAVFSNFIYPPEPSIQHTKCDVYWINYRVMMSFSSANQSHHFRTNTANNFSGGADRNNRSSSYRMKNAVGSNCVRTYKA
jgi:hypothetical protein